MPIWSESGSGSSEPILPSICSADTVGNATEAPEDDELGLSAAAEPKAKNDFSGTTGSKWWVSSLIIVNATLGAALLNFPKSFDSAGGILAATLVQLVLLILACGSLVILGWCADLRGSDNYQDTVATLCGRWGKQSCAAVIALCSYATCVAYLVIIGDQSDRILFDKIGQDFCNYWYMDRRFVVALSSIIVILPFCFSRKIDFLKYASSAATLSLFYLAFVAVYVYYISDTTGVTVKTRPTIWYDVFSILPTICFAYQCHVTVVPVYSCIQPHTLGNFAKSFLTALLICFGIYTTVGSYGYLTYGRNIEEDLLVKYEKSPISGKTIDKVALKNYNVSPATKIRQSKSNYVTSNGVVLSAFVVFAIKTFLSYPVWMFCGRIALDSLWIDFRKLDSVDQLLSEPIRRKIIAIVWFVSSLLVALFIPNIASVIDFLGCLGSVLMFVYPGLCLLKAVFIFESSLGKKQKIFGLLIASGYLVIGIFVFGLTLTQTVEYDLRLSHTKKESFCP